MQPSDSSKCDSQRIHLSRVAVLFFISTRNRSQQTGSLIISTTVILATPVEQEGKMFRQTVILNSSPPQALSEVFPDHLIYLFPLFLFFSVGLTWSIIYRVSWLFSPLGHTPQEDKDVCLFYSLILFIVLFTKSLE